MIDTTDLQPYTCNLLTSEPSPQLLGISIGVTYALRWLKLKSYAVEDEGKVLAMAIPHSTLHRQWAQMLERQHAGDERDLVTFAECQQILRNNFEGNAGAVVLRSDTLGLTNAPKSPLRFGDVAVVCVDEEKLSKLSAHELVAIGAHEGLHSCADLAPLDHMHTERWCDLEEACCKYLEIEPYQDREFYRDCRVHDAREARMWELLRSQGA